MALRPQEIMHQAEQFYAWHEKQGDVPIWDAFNHWERSKGFSTDESAAIWRVVKTWSYQLGSDTPLRRPPGTRRRPRGDSS